jgi:hypothetical protein
MVFNISVNSAAVTKDGIGEPIFVVNKVKGTRIGTTKGFEHQETINERSNVIPNEHDARYNELI